MPSIPHKNPISKKMLVWPLWNTPIHEGLARLFTGNKEQRKKNGFLLVFWFLFFVLFLIFQLQFPVTKCELQFRIHRVAVAFPPQFTLLATMGDPASFLFSQQSLSKVRNPTWFQYLWKEENQSANSLTTNKAIKNSWMWPPSVPTSHQQLPLCWFAMDRQHLKVQLYILENLLLLPQSAQLHSHTKESIVGYSQKSLLASSTSNTSAAQKTWHHSFFSPNLSPCSHTAPGKRFG